MKKRLSIALLIAFSLLITLPVAGQKSSPDGERMKWFDEAKLGIFIHWGIYAVNGIDESWSFYNGYIPYASYMDQQDGFTASAYNPDKWARLIKESGARYAVLTTKHHDGVALWDTKQGDLDVVSGTPAGRDLVAPLVLALRKEKLKVGLYYSLLDWSHPDYPNFIKDKPRYTEDTVRAARFTTFNHSQINELSILFNPDLFWFDGDWEQSAEWWKASEIRESILNHNGSAIINSRLQGYGDYATPEQGLPLVPPVEKSWELCMTINDSWGYQHNDNNYKSANQVIKIFSEVISLGGNLLLDIGPREDGTIPEEQEAVLKELGRWSNKHAEAIYKTGAGLPAGYFNGPSTLSADSTQLFLFINGKPSGNEIMLEGVKNEINRIYVVGEGTKLEYKEYLKPYWSTHSGVLFIKIPDKVLDSHLTVICLVLNGKLECDR